MYSCTLLLWSKLTMESLATFTQASTHDVGQIWGQVSCEWLGTEAPALHHLCLLQLSSHVETAIHILLAPSLQPRGFDHC